jgi:hypothetical protein
MIARRKIPNFFETLPGHVATLQKMIQSKTVEELQTLHELEREAAVQSSAARAMKELQEKARQHLYRLKSKVRRDRRVPE